MLVALHLAFLVALLAATDLDVGWNLDDGGYATQVKVLEQTDGWAYPYLHRDVDPTSRFAPVSHSTVTVAGTYPYAKFPAWALALRTTARLGSVGGLYVLPVAGAVLAALLGAVVAARLAPGSGPAAYGVLALGPLVVHADALWAHSVAAALGGAAALALVALAQDRACWFHRAVLVAAAGGWCLIRGEGPLATVALALVAAALGAVGVGPAAPGGPAPSSPERLRQAVSWGGPPLVAGGLVALASARWAAAVAPGAAVTATDEPVAAYGMVEARVRGATRTLLDGVGATPAGTLLAAVAVVLAVVGGAWLARPRGRTGPGPIAGAVLVAGASVLLVARSATVAPDDLGGLLVAVPLVAVAVGAWRWRGASPAERALVAFGLLHLAAVLATQYPEGGSRDWGGRFLFPVLVPLVAVAVVAVRRVLVGLLAAAPATSPVARLGPARGAALAVLLVAAVPSVGGWRSAERQRESNEALTEVTLGVDAPTIVKVPRYLTRVSWRVLPGPDWLSAEPATASEALALLRPGRTEPVAVVGPGADQVRAPGWTREVRSPVVVIFTPTGAG